MSEGPGVHPPASLLSEVRGRYTSQLRVGASVDAQRVLHGVSAVFSSSTSQFAAGILLVDVPSGATGTVTWSRETPAGERTLFSEQASLRPRGVLYASARGSDHVSPGLYRVHASIAGDEHDALFVVDATGPPASPPRGGLGTRGGLGKSLSAPVDTQPQPAPSADLQSGTTAVEATPDPCAHFTAPEDLQNCQDWYGEGPTTTNGPTTTYKCPSSLAPFVRIAQDKEALGGAVTINAFATLPGCPAFELTLAGAVHAAAPATVAHGSEDVQWAGSTCELPGASDTFGDVVEARATEPGDAPVTDRAVLNEFGPIAAPASQPPEGSLVHKGTKITLAVLAGVFGATHGIKSLVVRAPDGTELGHAGLPQPAPTCELTLARFVQAVVVTYRVSDNPPPVITLSVSAETFDGSRTAFPVRYATKPTWSGVLHLSADQTIPTNGGKQNWEYTGDVVVSETGVNQLEGQMHGEWTQTLELPVCPSETITPGSIDAPLTGTLDSTGMHLKAGTATSTPPVVTPCFGRQPGLLGNPLTLPEIAQLLDKLEPQGNGRFSASLEDTLAVGGAPTTVSADLQLDPGAGITPGSPARSLDTATPPGH